MAHGFLQSFDSGLTVESAGTEPGERVNPTAIKVMHELGIDISQHQPKHVNNFLNTSWDYVITVCGGAKESCPAFMGKVQHRIHLGFDDPSFAKGTEAFIMSEYYRVRDEIKNTFYKFYTKEIKSKRS